MLGSDELKVKILSQTPEIELFDNRNTRFICNVALHAEEFSKKITVYEVH